MLFWKKKTKRMGQDGWLKVDYRGPDIFVRLFGRLDHTVRNKIYRTLQPLLKHDIDGAICLQMTDVFLLDTASASSLVRFLRDANQCNVPIEVWGVSPVVIRVFEGLGVGELLKR